MRLFEHRVGFSDARGVAEINLQSSQPALFDEPQEILGLQPFDGKRFHAGKKLFLRRLVEREVGVNQFLLWKSEAAARYSFALVILYNALSN
jgi:hypothetical protein